MIRRADAPAALRHFFASVRWPDKVDAPAFVLCALSETGEPALVLASAKNAGAVAERPDKMIGCRCGADPLSLISTLAWLAERWPGGELNRSLRRQVVERVDLRAATTWCIELAVVFELLRRPPGSLPPIPDVLRSFGG